MHRFAKVRCILYIIISKGTNRFYRLSSCYKVSGFRSTWFYGKYPFFLITILLLMWYCVVCFHCGKENRGFMNFIFIGPCVDKNYCSWRSTTFVWSKRVQQMESAVDAYWIFWKKSYLGRSTNLDPHKVLWITQLRI